MSKCLGCGVLLQSSDSKQLGYITNEDDSFCQRCFRIKNYNDYKLVTKDNEEFIEILKNINITDDLVILVVDVFNPGDLEFFYKYLTNDILLVITKRDLIPKSVTDEKLLNYFDYKCVDKILISSYKNYNFDELFNLIKKHKKSDCVYVIGYTNAGKSTLINKIIYNYDISTPVITTSILPSTTLNNIEIKLNDFILIDTPGIVSEGNIINILEPKKIKKITAQKEIKPITYQVKTRQTFTVDDLFQISCSKGNLTFYLANQLIIKRQYKDIDNIVGIKKQFNVKANSDLVVEGLGFVKFTNDCQIDTISLKGVDVYLRKSLI